MISRGLRGRAPHVKIFVHFGGSAPQILYQSYFSKHIDLTSNGLYGIAIMNFLTTIWLLRSL